MDDSCVEMKGQLFSPLKFTLLENEIQTLKNERCQKQIHLARLEQILLRHQRKLEENEKFPPGFEEVGWTYEHKNEQQSPERNYDSQNKKSETQEYSEMLQKKIIVLEKMLLRQQKCIDEIEKKALQLNGNENKKDQKIVLKNLLSDMKIVGLRCLSDSALLNSNQCKQIISNKQFPVNRRNKTSVASLDSNNEKKSHYSLISDGESFENIELNKKIYILEKKLDALIEVFLQEKKFILITNSYFTLNKDIERKLELELKLFTNDDDTSSSLLKTLKCFHEQSIKLDVALREQEMVLRNAMEDLQEIQGKDWMKYFQPYEEIKKLETTLIEKEFLLQQSKGECSGYCLQIETLKNSLLMYKNQVDLAAKKIKELENECQLVKEEVNEKNLEILKIQDKYFQVNEILGARNEEVKTLQQLWNEFDKDQKVEDQKQQDETKDVTKNEDSDSLNENDDVDSLIANLLDEVDPSSECYSTKKNLLVATQDKEKESDVIKKEKYELEVAFNDLSLKYKQLNNTLDMKKRELINLENRMEAFQKDAIKKDKLIQQFREEMNYLQNITNQLEDYHRGVRERDNKIFQLETDLDCELRNKEEKELIALNFQQRIKIQKTEIEEKDKRLMQSQQALEDNENKIKSLKEAQTNLQGELQEKENQYNNLQEELIKVEAIVQEMKNNKLLLQLQNETLQNKLDLLRSEKEKSDKKETILQRKLLDVSNEMKSAEKLISTWRDKVNQKNLEIKAMSQVLEQKEHFILCQQNDIDKVIQCNDEQELYIQTLEQQIKELQSEIAEKNTSTSIFSFLPDFSSDHTPELPIPQLLKGEVTALQAVLENKNEIINKLQQCVEKKTGHIQFFHTLYITLQNDFQNKDKKILNLTNKVASMEDEVISLEEIKIDLEKTITVLHQENDEKNIHLRSLETAISNAQRELEEKRLRMQNLRAQMHSIQIKYQKTAKERDDKKFSESNLITQIANLDHKIQNVLKENSEKESMFESLNSRIKELENGIDICHKINDRKEHKIQVLNCQLGTIKIELEDREKVIGNLQSEMSMLREKEHEKNIIIEQQKLQAKRNQSRLENFNSIIQHLQSEIALLKEEFSSQCNGRKNNKEESEILKSQIHVLVSEMEMWQYKLQAAQIDWEEKENIYQILNNQITNLHNRLKEKKQAYDNLETEKVTEDGKQTQEFQRHCLYMEMKILQEELESKQTALKEATEHLKETEKQKKHIENEVNTLLTEMEDVQEKHNALDDSNESNKFSK